MLLAIFISSRHIAGSKKYRRQRSLYFFQMQLVPLFVFLFLVYLKETLADTFLVDHKISIERIVGIDVKEKVRGWKHRPVVNQPTKSRPLSPRFYSFYRNFSFKVRRVPPLQDTHGKIEFCTVIFCWTREKLENIPKMPGISFGNESHAFRFRKVIKSDPFPYYSNPIPYLSFQSLTLEVELEQGKFGANVQESALAILSDRTALPNFDDISILAEYSEVVGKIEVARVRDNNHNIVGVRRVLVPCSVPFLFLSFYPPVEFSSLGEAEEGIITIIHDVRGSAQMLQRSRQTAVSVWLSDVHERVVDAKKKKNWGKITTKTTVADKWLPFSGTGWRFPVLQTETTPLTNTPAASKLSQVTFSNQTPYPKGSVRVLPKKKIVYKVRQTM